MGLRGRHDPLAMIKAGAITALCYMCAQSVPEAQQRAFSEWALMQEPTFIKPAARPLFVCIMIFLLGLGLIIDQRQAIWRRLFFVAIPKTQPNHTGCVIWLHGVGDRGAGFWWLAKRLGDLEHVKWVLPDADLRDLSLLTGYRTRAWVDVKAMPITPSEPVEQAELDAAAAGIIRLIDAQLTDGIPASRIVLGGFSQGAMVAAWAAAKYPHRLGAVVLWSGYLGDKAAALSAQLRASKYASGTPFTYGHGADDPKVLPACGTCFIEALRDSKVDLVAAKIYERVTHGCAEEQVDALRQLLCKTVPSKAAVNETKKDQ